MMDMDQRSAVCPLGIDRDLRLPRLLQELDDRGARLRLESGQLRVEHGEKLRAELCDEVNALRLELVAYLRTQGQEVVDDPVEKSHSDMRSLPAPELSRDDKLAASLKASKRRYQNGMVGINDHKFAHHMRELVRLQERRQAADRGEIVEGRYLTRFDIFG